MPTVPPVQPTQHTCRNKKGIVGAQPGTIAPSRYSVAAVAYAAGRQNMPPRTRPSDVTTTIRRRTYFLLSIVT